MFSFNQLLYRWLYLPLLISYSLNTSKLSHLHGNTSPKAAAPSRRPPTYNSGYRSKLGTCPLRGYLFTTSVTFRDRPGFSLDNMTLGKICCLINTERIRWKDKCFLLNLCHFDENWYAKNIVLKRNLVKILNLFTSCSKWNIYFIVVQMFKIKKTTTKIEE